MFWVIWLDEDRRGHRRAGLAARLRAKTYGLSPHANRTAVSGPYSTGGSLGGRLLRRRRVGQRFSGGGQFRRDCEALQEVFRNNRNFWSSPLKFPTRDSCRATKHYQTVVIHPSYGIRPIRRAFICRQDGYVQA